MPITASPFDRRVNVLKAIIDEVNRIAAVTAPTVKVDTYTTAGAHTWTKPAGAVRVEVELVAGGHGGGSGRCGAAGTLRYGGGGGTFASRTARVFDAADLPATVAVTVGAGGTGGAAVTADDTDGNIGAVGGRSLFGTLAGSVPASGVVAGIGGTALAGGGAGTSTANLVGATNATLWSATIAGPAAGGGGGISAANVANIGGAGSCIYDEATTVAAAGGAIDAPGADAVARVPAGLSGRSGGGGGASLTGPGGRGGNGSSPAGSGGGGGASVNGNASGAGGNGAAGLVRVVTYL